MTFALRRYIDTGNDHVNEQLALFSKQNDQIQFVELKQNMFLPNAFLQVYPCDERVPKTTFSFKDGLFFFGINGNELSFLGSIADPDLYFYFEPQANLARLYAVEAKSKEDAEKEMKILLGLCFVVLSAAAAAATCGAKQSSSSLLENFYFNVNRLIMGEIMRVRTGARKDVTLPPLCQTKLPLDCKERGAQNPFEVSLILLKAYTGVTAFSFFHSSRLSDSLYALDMCPKTEKLNEVAQVAPICSCATNIVQCAWSQIGVFIPWLIAAFVCIVTLFFWICIAIVQNS